ncbi:GNAT family N-acetyltransferase [Prosthecomicrobium hirschii]|uniref:GNAT family N-acetyltransferase n=2 Tax=Prosthecodimorpha hirschii TaxID=665126 RepID=UPI00221F0B51|nr:N-acetyltransferase [Prosthecomicrobium hirschii]MCW1841099.1 N-acetyltransferase [Prosthecomicrobium hirschii]
MSAFAIEAAQPTDAAAIRALLVAAFPTPAEADLVAALRLGGYGVLELVARATGAGGGDGGGGDDGNSGGGNSDGGNSADRAILGHLLFSRLTVAPPNDRRRAVCLAPLAVAPGRQTTGIGTALVREGLARLEASGEDIVLVLGDPAYYGRFGFHPGRPERMLTPYPIPENQWLALGDRPLPLRLALSYPPPFAALG